MPGRIAATAGLAIFAGIALSLRDLLLPPPRQIPLPLEDLVLVAWVFSLVVIGWATAQLIDPPVRFVVAPAAALVAVGVALLAKQLRYPDAPLTGDGFEILIWVWAVIALAAAVFGRYPAVRVRSGRLAGAIGAGLLMVAGAVGAVPYVLAR
jgi:hypothetical protein